MIKVEFAICNPKSVIFNLKSVICNSAIALLLMSPLLVYGDERLNLAVAEFEARNVSAMDAVTVSDFLRTELVKTEVFNVVDRSNMQKILAEQRFQMTGCTNQECAVQMGKILNVQKIVIGSLSKLVGLYYLTANVIDVETGQITLSERVECPVETELLTAVEKLSHLLEVRILGKKSPFPEERRVELNRTSTFISRVIDEKTVAINRGIFDGVKKRDLYSIWKVEETTTQKVGRLMVSSVGNNESVSRIIKIKEDEKIKVGYPVIYENAQRKIAGINGKFIGAMVIEDFYPVSLDGACLGIGLSYDYIGLMNFGFSVESRWFFVLANRESGLLLPSQYYWCSDLEIAYPLLFFAKYRFNYDHFFSPCLGLGLAWAYLKWERSNYYNGFFSEEDTGNRISPVFHIGADLFSTSMIHLNISSEYILVGKFHNIVGNTISLSVGLSLNW